MADPGRLPPSRIDGWAASAVRAQGAASLGRAVAVVAVLLAASWLVSYLLGGAGRVPPHWFYVPVLVAAARFGRPGAAITAVVAGLLSGPLLPLDVSTGTPQQLLDWSGRLAFFLAIGFVMGTIVVRLRTSLAREVALAQEERDLASRKAAFIGTISHELRTPLTVVQGVSKTLEQQGWVAEPGRPLLESLHRASERLMDIVIAVLTAVEGRRGRSRPVDVHAVCDDIARGLERLGAASRVRLAGEPERAVVVSDPELVKQALRHLIENALKFSPPDEPVTIDVTRNGHGVEVRVQDRGPGVDPRFLRRAFDPFTQADAATTRRHGGLGIGLFVSRHLVETIGGSVDLLPHAHGGTVAVVRIPDLQERQADAAAS